MRGGSEAIHTNRLLHSIMQEVLLREGVDPNTVTFIDSTDRNDVKELLSLDKYIDVIIPRGGEALHRLCQKESTIPVIVGGFGICHIFVDESADLEKSVGVVINAKVQKPSACNALDTLLIHKKVAEDFLAKLKAQIESLGVTLVVHGTELSQILKNLGYNPRFLVESKDEDFDTEWLSLKLNVALVDNLDEVLLHLRVHRATQMLGVLLKM